MNNGIFINNKERIESIMNGDSGTDMPSTDIDINEITNTKIEFIENIKEKINMPFEYPSRNLNNLELFPDDLQLEITSELLEFYVNTFELTIIDFHIIVNDLNLAKDLLNQLFDLLTNNIVDNTVEYLSSLLLEKNDVYYKTLLDETKIDLDSLPIKFLQKKNVSKRVLITLIYINELLSNTEIAVIAFNEPTEFVEIFKGRFKFLEDSEQSPEFVTKFLMVMLHSEMMKSILQNRIKAGFLISSKGE